MDKVSSDSQLYICLGCHMLVVCYVAHNYPEEFYLVRVVGVGKRVELFEEVDRVVVGVSCY